jgi:YVTN family beta-propeller protein
MQPRQRTEIPNVKNQMLHQAGYAATERKLDKTRSQRISALIQLASALACCALILGGSPAEAREPSHEVWLLDQSNSYDSDMNGTLDSGGTLYIFDGSTIAGEDAPQADVEVIDLGGAISSAVKLQTGTAPVRPHYLAFNAAHTHAIVSFVATGHVLIIEAATRQVVFQVDVGAQAHAAVASPDDQYILVANQNGKLLQRINTDYATNSFTLDNAATLNLAAGVTPSGAPKQDELTRPDTAPILALPDASGDLAFVTLRGGGLFVVDARSTPIQIVAEYTRATVAPAGLLAIQAGDKLYFNSGGGGGATLGFQSILYRLPVSAFSTTPSVTPNSPAPVVVFDHSNRQVKDSHGLAVTKHERYLWVADRADNRIIVVDTETDAVANEIPLAGDASPDPAPDILGVSPSGNRIYSSLRGPNPLTGNNAVVNNAKGATPGLGVIQVIKGGKAGSLKTAFVISNIDAFGIERADAHGLAVRNY